MTSFALQQILYYFNHLLPIAASETGRCRCGVLRKTDRAGPSLGRDKDDNGLT